MNIIVSKKDVDIVEHEGEIYKRLAHSLTIEGVTKTFHSWANIKTWDEQAGIVLEAAFQKDIKR